MAKPMDELELLRAVDFDWTRHTSSVWQDNPYHTAELHANERQALLAEFSRLRQQEKSQSLLGQIIMGNPGAGKTHLLGSLRQAVIEQNAWFVLVDMTDVNDFWETTRQGYIDSLLQPLANGEYQYQRLLQFLLEQAPRLSNSQQMLAELADLNSEEFKKAFLRWVAGSKLDQRYRKEFMEHFHTLRALFLLNSNDFQLRDAGFSWLSSLELEPGDNQRYGFRTPQPDAFKVVRGLSWAMSLTAPTMLAYDQLDAIVSQYNKASFQLDTQNPEATEQERRAAAIISGIGGGLMAAYDQLSHTLTVVSCLNETWNILEQYTADSFSARFDDPPKKLWPLSQQNIAERLITQRLQAAFKQYDYQPPYPSWPFKPEAFSGTDKFTPRELLKWCNAHRKKCLQTDQVIELDELSPSTLPEPVVGELSALDDAFADLQNQANIDILLDQNHEDGLAAEIIRAACRCLLKEHRFPEHIDAVVEEDFSKGASYTSLHARIRLIFHKEGDREQHICLRVLQKTHATAYKNRLKAAMTAAGIDARLDFRRLLILRNNDLPSGPLTKMLTEKFIKAGGLFAHPDQQTWSRLWAVAQMEQQQPQGFEHWLRQQQPISKLPLFQASGISALVADLSDRASPNPPPGTTPRKHNKATGMTKPIKPEPDAISKSATESPQLLIGQQLVANYAGSPVYLPASILTRHTVLLAGAGSGKTVLIRRLIETAALAGIPSVVVDPGNDLARLGDAWPNEPEGWFEQDADRARRYFEQVDVNVWTPGREKGNPLYLSPLPDLAAAANDADELQIAVTLAQDALKDIVAPGVSEKAHRKMGVLAAALKYFVQTANSAKPTLNLNHFIHLLADLPAAATGEISDGEKLASDMANSLRATLQTDPLLQSTGTPLDPGILFGLNRAKTRVSVLNLSGLPGLQSQQRFVGQLAMSLFGWIKRHPAAPEQFLRGLLIIDEAKDFLPANQRVASREPLLRLAAQARKYGLGLVFATQAPSSIDHQYIANCTTHIYGKASSPRAIEVTQEQIRQRGGTGSDIARLVRGSFYLYSEGFSAPIKISTPLCLSHHPPTPLDDEGILQRAEQSKARLIQ